MSAPSDPPVSSASPDRAGRLRRLALLNRFSATVLTAVFVGVVVISVVAYHHTRATAENMAATEMLQALELLDRDVTVRVRDLVRRTVMASQDEMLPLALEESYLGRAAGVALRRRLDTLVRGGDFGRLHLVDRTGRVVLATEELPQGGMNVADTLHFRQAMTGRPMVGYMMRPPGIGMPILVAEVPVRQGDGTVVGVLSAIENVDDLTRDIMSRSNVGHSGVPYILNGEGELLAASVQAGPDDWHSGPAALAVLREHEGDGEEGVHFVRRGDQLRLISFRRNAETGWYLVIDADESEVLAPARRLAAVSGGISLVTLACVALALSALQRTMARLRNSEERFSSLFRLSPDSVLLVVPETGVVEDVNDTLAAACGQMRAALVGRTVRDLGILPDEAVRQSVWELLEREGSIRNVEVAGRVPDMQDRGDGREVFHSLSGQAMDIGGRHLFMLVLRDVTELKKMQEVMIQTEKMISVGGIAAGIAHEINNPLGAIMQASQNMQQRMNTVLPANINAAREAGLDLDSLQRYLRARKVDRFIEDIRAAAIRASGIIRHMLDFSRSSAARSTAGDLRGLVARAVNLAASDYDLKKNYDFRKISIDIRMADDLPHVPCVETEVEQVLLNLLRNAAQALSGMNPPRDDPRIVLRAFAQDGWLRLEVEDNGPGMSPEVQRRIFEPFYTTKPPGVGTGLGLSVSYFIVTKGHEGRMAVESRPGEGSVFRIDLPVGGPSVPKGGGKAPPDGGAPS